MSYTAERLGLTVFMHSAAQPATMPLVKRVLAELASHPRLRDADELADQDKGRGERPA